MLSSPAVLYEDNHLLVVEKARGWIVQGAALEDDSLLEWGKSYLKRKYDKPGNVFLAAVSRLDRGVSGVVPLARTSKAAARMNDQIRQRLVKKIYLAIVSPPPPTPHATLRHFIIRDDTLAQSFAYDTPRGGAAEAELRYETVTVHHRYALLQIELITGRKHQIRAQLAALGSLIVGDRKYGSLDFLAGGIALHCCRFEMLHPTRNEPMIFTSEADWLKRGPWLGPKGSLG